MSEPEIWSENVANMQLKLAPKKDFEGLLNESTTRSLMR